MRGFRTVFGLLLERLPIVTMAFNDLANHGAQNRAFLLRHAVPDWMRRSSPKSGTLGTPRMPHAVFNDIFRGAFLVSSVTTRASWPSALNLTARASTYGSASSTPDSLSGSRTSGTAARTYLTSSNLGATLHAFASTEMAHAHGRSGRRLSS